MVGLRDRLIRNCTQLSNAIRSYAAEFGFTAAKGKAHLVPLLERVQAGESVPILARELFAAQAEEYARLQGQIDKVDAELMAWHKANECSRRLAKIPSVGPIGAALLMMKTPAPEMFRSGRQFAAWIGLTPKDHSTAGKGQARHHHPGRRRDLAQRVGGWGYPRHPTCSTRRTRGALDRGPSQAQTAEVGRGGAGQQGGPRRLEADGQWSMLLCEIGTHRVGACRIEISQTRGAIQLQPC